MLNFPFVRVVLFGIPSTQSSTLSLVRGTRRRYLPPARPSRRHPPGVSLQTSCLNVPLSPHPGEIFSPPGWRSRPRWSGESSGDQGHSGPRVIHVSCYLLPYRVEGSILVSRRVSSRNYCKRPSSFFPTYLFLFKRGGCEIDVSSTTYESCATGSGVPIVKCQML